MLLGFIRVDLNSAEYAVFKPAEFSMCSLVYIKLNQASILLSSINSIPKVLSASKTNLKAFLFWSA